MAAPYFQIRDDLKRWGVAVFSSNYALYGDMSERVMTVIEQRVPAVEVYPIDEAFADLTGVPEVENRHRYGRLGMRRARRRAFLYRLLLQRHGVSFRPIWRPGNDFKLPGAIQLRSVVLNEQGGRRWVTSPALDQTSNLCLTPCVIPQLL
jgi:hypothetical protein